MIIKKFHEVARELTRPQKIGALESAFCELLNLPHPKRETRQQKSKGGTFWWSPLGELLDLCGEDVQEARRLMVATIKRMRNDDLTISSPKSIINVAIDEYSKSQRRSKGVSVW